MEKKEKKESRTISGALARALITTTSYGYIYRPGKVTFLTNLRTLEVDISRTFEDTELSDHSF